MNYVDQIFNFKGQWDAQSRCGLKIVRKPDRHIVIATELYEENPGTSVTNFNAQLAALIVKDFALDPEKLVFIERCPDLGSKMEHYKESFDIVRFKWDGSSFSDPEWEGVGKKEIDEMIHG